MSNEIGQSYWVDERQELQQFIIIENEERFPRTLNLCDLESRSLVHLDVQGLQKLARPDYYVIFVSSQQEQLKNLIYIEKGSGVFQS